MDTSRSARREYLRMREENAINNRVSNATCFTFVDETDSVPKATQSMFVVDDVIKEQRLEPEVISFPFNDTSTVSNPNEGEDRQSRRSHGATFTMISAIVHMKNLAHRRAKLAKDESNLSNSKSHDYSPNYAKDDVIEDDPWKDVRQCRYLRKYQEKELSVDEIFRS